MLQIGPKIMFLLVSVSLATKQKSFTITATDLAKFRYKGSYVVTSDSFLDYDFCNHSVVACDNEPQQRDDDDELGRVSASVFAVLRRLADLGLHHDSQFQEQSAVYAEPNHDPSHYYSVQVTPFPQLLCNNNYL